KVAYVSAAHVVAASADSGSTITPSGDVPVPNGGDATFSFSAKPGYVIVAVEIDGSKDMSAVSAGSYEFSGVASGRTISVTSKLMSTGGPNAGGDGSSGGSGSGNGPGDGSGDGNENGNDDGPGDGSNGGDASGGESGDGGSKGALSGTAGIIAVIIVAIAVGVALLWLLVGGRDRRRPSE
ncbi:MAG: hypothetical protein LBS92_00280, partial [Candidatus Methanoplasma sp.]|nr:hypothetical protein [Candidatus Methanoplasma sp.]